MADVDPKIWEAKDLRISKLSCLSTAAACHSTESVDMNVLITEAEQLLKWVYGENIPNNKVSDTSYPTPTLEQKEALDKVQKETGLTPSQVWAKFGVFPVAKNVDRCIARIKENK